MGHNPAPLGECWGTFQKTFSVAPQKTAWNLAGTPRELYREAASNSTAEKPQELWAVVGGKKNAHQNPIFYTKRVLTNRVFHQLHPAFHHFSSCTKQKKRYCPHQKAPSPTFFQAFLRAEGMRSLPDGWRSIGSQSPKNHHKIKHVQ